jgi:CRISPR/Cas system-associated exonuclease Cas4 (RecB family)
VVTYMEMANEAAEKLAETTRDSYQTVVDHAVGLQERNVRFAQGIVDDSIEELRHQVESNRAMSQEFVERIEKQRDAYQALVERSLDAYMDLAYAPFSYYKEGLQAAKKVAR